ncbi:MAG: peptide chain release factor-like protein [Elusimicrobia bacterium CG08_land_8_20_14_0_20_59_10]|nr:MAG: peptide chain release factor-like protein [Elusimicrobia bacterium CG08_land_8_20_14_0_20_59_10]
MNFPELSDITPAKVSALKERIARLGLDLRLVEEQFIRGGGKGGQKINKTANAVLLKYPPLALVVRCQRERKRSLNRFLALRELTDEIELRVSPGTSQRLKEIARIRRRKADKARKRKTGLSAEAGPGSTCSSGWRCCS